VSTSGIGMGGKSKALCFGVQSIPSKLNEQALREGGHDAHFGTLILLERLPMVKVRAKG